MPLSPELTRLLRHVRRTSPDPAHLDDANESLDALSDAKLALICRVEHGPAVRLPNPLSLRYSSKLRAQLASELDELELNLPAENAEGWLEPLVTTPSRKRDGFLGDA